ncbi:MAG: type II toxin-antitoxin system CcdA family antitoxin [Nitrososphaerota archaeon]|nr:type II toxin-antitoxin system CcdA family antitoxin [Candidatus Bathyarchaeota archaeon]MDW8049309.1 type II toxin-antitoxin system CcdA family antitoxin [Nitrososphaerota archaeon]
MSDAVISVRVPRELKKELKKHEVNISEVVRRALEEEVRRRKMKRLQEAAAKLGEFFAGIPDEEIIKSVKMARMER